MQALAERRLLRKQSSVRASGSTGSLSQDVGGTPLKAPLLKGPRVRFAVEEGEGPGDTRNAEQPRLSPRLSPRASPQAARRPPSAPRSPTDRVPLVAPRPRTSPGKLLQQAESIKRQLRVHFLPMICAQIQKRPARC